MEIASNAKKVLTDFNKDFQNIESIAKPKHLTSSEAGKRIMNGIDIRFISNKSYTEEIWEMNGLDEIINEYVQKFFKEYCPQGYSSFVLKLEKDKYYFYNSKSCD